MKPCDRRIILSCLLAMAPLLGLAQDLDTRVARAIVELTDASARECLEWCDRLTAPEERAEKHDTEARMVLHGAALQAGGGAEKLRSCLQEAFVTVLRSQRPSAIKAFVLEQLQLVADDTMLPAVVPYLTDPVLCDRAARLVATVGGPNAATSLADALRNSDGNCRLSLVQALADLGAREALETLMEASESDDRDLRLAALRALAATGDPQAHNTILQATRDESAFVRAHATSAYLAYLRQRIAAGKAAESLPRLFALRDAHPEAPHIHCAVLQLLGQAGGEAAAAAVLDGLRNENPRIRKAAGQALKQLPADLAAPKLMDMLEQASSESRVAVMKRLAEIGSAGALPALRREMSGEDSKARAAAIRAIGAVAGKDALPELIPWLTDPRKEASNAAVAAIRGMTGSEVGKALASTAKQAPPQTAAAILDVMAQRLDIKQTPTVISMLDSNSPDLRVAAWKALGNLGEASQVNTLAARMAVSRDSSELKAAQKALSAICRRSAQPEVTGPALAAVLDQANPEALQALLPVFTAAGGKTALQAVTETLEKAEKQIRTAAVRALADWRDPSALPALRRVIENDASELNYVLAFRGYVRLLEVLEVPVTQKLDRFAEAMQQARRTEEQKQVLGGMGAVEHREGLARLRPFLENEDLREEAASAIVRLASAVRGDDGIQALKAVLNTITDGPVAERAREALSDLARYAGCVGIWQLSGPYTDNNKGHTAVFPVPFPPETEPEKAEWKRITAQKDGRVDLMEEVGGNNRCAYLRCNVMAPEETEAVLQAGSDDGVKVWLNGNVVHENNVPRAFVWGEDEVPLVLLKGTNTLMLKITQGGGGWMANARLRKTDGTPIDGLNFAVGPALKKQARKPLRQMLAAGAPSAEKLGWRVAIQCWSFNRTSFLETVDRARHMGVKYLEMYPGQAVSREQPDWKTNQDMPPEAFTLIREALDDSGIQVLNFGVTGIPQDEARQRKLFEWAKAMGIKTICSEPDPARLPEIDRLCQEYKINVALHNHPKPNSTYWNPQTVVESCEGLSDRIGACADTGHWMRSDIKPLDAIKQLEGRIITFHFKDLNQMGKKGHDVHWGRGAAELPAVLRLLKEQNFKGVFSCEYEHNWGKNTADIAACVRNFEAMAKEIVLEEDGVWQVLFNMRDLDAWQNSRGDAPGSGWTIDGDCLRLKGKGGYIWTRERFGDFVLDLEFNTEGNSGLFFRTDNPADPVQTGIEMQVHTADTTGKHGVGAIYDLLAPSTQAAKADWNQVTLSAQDNRITIVLNDTKIVDMDLDQWDQAGTNPDGSKNKFERALKEYRRAGHIGFQDHGSPVRYRHVRIRHLP